MLSWKDVNIAELDPIDKQRVRTFYKRFHRLHQDYLPFTCHAAFPIILTPDLLHKLWMNFRGTSTTAGHSFPIPIATADILFSPLCRNIGNGVFEMHPTIRHVFLQVIKNNPELSLPHLERLAYFLQYYLEENKKFLPTESYRRALSWQALTFTNPEEAARQLLGLIGEDGATLSLKTEQSIQQAKSRNKLKEKSAVNTRLTADPLRIAVSVADSKLAYQEGDLDSSVQILKAIKDFLSFMPPNEKSVKVPIPKAVIEKLELKREQTLSKEAILHPYKEAKRYALKKEFDKAISLYQRAIEIGNHPESAIKDLAMIYHQKKETVKGIQVLEDHMHMIAEKGPAYGMLVSLSYAIKNYEQTIEYLIKADQYADQERKPFILRFYGLCYLQLRNHDKAEEYFRQLLSYNKDDQGAIQALEALAQYRESGDVDLLSNIVGTLKTDGIEELSLSAELSPLLKRAFAQNNYEGVPEFVRGNKDFSQTTLRALRIFIKEAGRARPEERARYLLTEAKLMQQFEPENTVGFKAVLARYCNSMALVTAGQNYPNTVVRSYYLEAFYLEDSWDSLVRQVGVYISSYTLRGKDLVRMAEQVRSGNILEKIFSQVPEEKHGELWNGTLDMFIANREITRRVLDIINQNEMLFDSSVQFLKQNDPSLGKILTEEDLKHAWLKMRRDRYNGTIKLMAPYQAIQKESVSRKTYEKIIWAGQEVQDTPWLLKLDQNRAQRLTDIGQDFDDFFRATSFDTLEYRYQLLEQKIQALLVEIEQQPTLFSVRTFLPLCEFLLDSFQRSFAILAERSKPKIKLTLLSKYTLIEPDGVINVRLLVENKVGRSPIEKFQLSPIANEDCIVEDSKIITNDIIRGGQSKVLSFKVRITGQARDNKVARLEFFYLYSYNKGQAQEEKKETLDLPLYSESQFVHITNIYAHYAQTGPVRDKSMFFGRDKLIDEIVNEIENDISKCILLYGQKRSGKSSVLYHVSEMLKASGKTISVKFSIGDIIGSEDFDLAFFYRICRIISNYFEGLSSNTAQGKPTIPDINIEEFKEQPYIQFDDFMRSLRRNMTKLPHWKNQKIVLCIDEFSYLYVAILQGTLKPEFMKTFKSILEKDYFSAILVGQDMMHKFKAAFPNEFGVTSDMRLPYLDKKAARELIEQPIWDTTNNKSRYVGEAADGVVEWTAGNPYYIQMFCARLVEQMNAQKSINITRLDVDKVAEDMISGNNSLQIDKFDNLLTAGDADVEQFEAGHVLGILKSIAVNTNTHLFCTRDQIKTIVSKEEDDQVLADLLRREVITLEEGKYYKIVVKLFEQWLLQ